ncbi:cytidine deaminase [Chengkuizengella sediminis]|uniref:cytidine deaminase n=1 Tax=Chengkuizengella sediminis TaxID=1885917 RepID=UPI001389B723|nr:cytidine deaminase [Chengkuizengella sediminis]NDI33714.1 cytidine deaminase [Chengkuizengella sediminis]
MDKETLIKKAIEAMDSAYAPYSNFRVGAALLSDDGVIHIGCNVENAAYGPTNCAERTAMFRAIADGYKPKSFKAIAVAGDTEDPISPCGVCRQVLVELCSEKMPVILVNLKGDQLETTVSELLPGAFQL